MVKAGEQEDQGERKILGEKKADNSEEESGEESDEESEGEIDGSDDEELTPEPELAPRTTSTPTVPTVDPTEWAEQAHPVDFELKVGDRLHIPRDDEAAPTAASVVALRSGDVALFVWDDMMWAGHPTKEVELGLKKGSISRVKEEEDVPPCKRARALLSPANMAPDCFFFDERTWPVPGAIAWRWFGILAPAPPDGKHNQKYSAPRIADVLRAGSRVTMCGRAARLVPWKRKESKEPLCTSTPFTVLGFVQASLPAQKSYWIVVTSHEHEVKDTNLYVATIFGKGPEEVHVTTLDVEPELGALDEASLDASIQMAMVSGVQPFPDFHLLDFGPYGWNDAQSLFYVCVGLAFLAYRIASELGDRSC